MIKFAPFSLHGLFQLSAIFLVDAVAIVSTDGEKVSSIILPIHAIVYAVGLTSARATGMLISKNCGMQKDLEIGQLIRVSGLLYCLISLGFSAVSLLAQPILFYYFDQQVAHHISYYFVITAIGLTPSLLVFSDSQLCSQEKAMLIQPSVSALVFGLTGYFCYLFCFRLGYSMPWAAFSPTISQFIGAFTLKIYLLRHQYEKYELFNFSRTEVRVGFQQIWHEWRSLLTEKLTDWWPFAILTLSCLLLSETAFEAMRSSIHPRAIFDMIADYIAHALVMPINTNIAALRRLKRLPHSHMDEKKELLKQNQSIFKTAKRAGIILVITFILAAYALKRLMQKLHLIDHIQDNSSELHTLLTYSFYVASLASPAKTIYSEFLYAYSGYSQKLFL